MTQSRMEIERIIIFGCSGKLGRHLSAAFSNEGYRVRGFVHRNAPESVAEICKGDIRNYSDVEKAVEGCDAVVQLATTKEDPETFFDVSIRGTFNVLEACRRQHRTKQIILSGGDASFGIWFYPQPVPIDENHPLMAYPGYYAFSKVIEETMMMQYKYQYDLPTTILRSSWIFEKDDLLKHLSVFNVDPQEKGHGWDQYLTEEHRSLIEAGEDRIPIVVDKDGVPYKRHIVQVDDVVQAYILALGNPVTIGESFNVAGPAPFTYDVAANYLSKRTGIPVITIQAPSYHSFEIDITKARTVLAYEPKYDIFKMIDSALAFRQGRQVATK